MSPVNETSFWVWRVRNIDGNAYFDRQDDAEDYQRERGGDLERASMTREQFNSLPVMTEDDK